MNVFGIVKTNGKNSLLKNWILSPKNENEVISRGPFRKNTFLSRIKIFVSELASA